MSNVMFIILVDLQDACLKDRRAYCRITWSLCCAVRTVRLFVKQFGCFDSVYFSNNPLKFRTSNQISLAAMTSAPDEKWRPFNVFPVQVTGGSATGPDPENRVGDQDTGMPGRPVSCGLQVFVEAGHCHARTRPRW